MSRQLTDFSSQLPYRVPAVRHLAWMCRAPGLIASPPGFTLAEHLPDSLEERLKAWDQSPEKGPAVLTQTPARRLGHYFEQLYECLMKDLLGWEVLLKNQPVRSNGMTLGELDFIVRNPADNVVEHHEIAVKFYLGYANPGQSSPLWYGPNSKDRLDLKTARLVTHQSRLAEKPETLELLHARNIPTPTLARIFMPGYLFYPVNFQVPSPEGIPSDHLRGEWLYIDDLDGMNSARATPDQVEQHWIPLIKPHWLSPWRQPGPPDARLTAEALETVRSLGMPRLFAVMEQTDEPGVWQEHHRVFVVPGNWPA
jgi:hypothetical protein